MNFSKTLKTLRKEKHLTQEQLASYLNISRNNDMKKPPHFPYKNNEKVDNLKY